MVRSPAASRHPGPARPGFTLAELILALVILGCAAFALVGASAGAIHAVAAAEAQTAATNAARDRLEGLASAECSTLRPGAAVDSLTGIREQWSVERFRNGVILLIDSAEYLDRDGAHAIALQRLVLC